MAIAAARILGKEQEYSEALPCRVHPDVETIPICGTQRPVQEVGRSGAHHPNPQRARKEVMLDQVHQFEIFPPRWLTVPEDKCNEN